jgi:very-short-patch-repair endonuclease
MKKVRVEADRTLGYYQKEFIEKCRSVNEIAEEWGTYANKIRRELIHLGFQTNNKSDAQKRAIASGRAKHPTLGTKRDEKTRVKISASMAEKWREMDDDEKARRVQLAKHQWDNMSAEDRASFRDASMVAIRESSKNGSKMEKFLFDGLQKLGYDVLFHSEHILPKTRLQTDLFLPGLKTVIEVDGPSHFLPIWGEESLAKNMEADAKKNSALLTYGFVVIRIKAIAKNMSQVGRKNLLSKVAEVLEQNKVNFPELTDRLIEITLD